MPRPETRPPVGKEIGGADDTVAIKVPRVVGCLCQRQLQCTCARVETESADPKQNFFIGDNRYFHQGSEIFTMGCHR